MLALVSDVFSEFRPRVVALVGIAAGLDEELSVGDVVVASSVFRYERAKLLDGTIEHELIPSTLPVASMNELVGLVGNLRNSLKWPHELRIGSYAAGEKVVADELSETARWLRRTNRKLQALEMESGGFFKGLLTFRGALEAGTFWFVAKGISDLADAESMSGPTDPDARRLWLRERAENQETAARRSARTALMLSALHLGGAAGQAEA